MTNKNATIGMALVGGYLLGRTKKAKMAIGLGMFLAGKKLNLDPRQLASMVGDSPLLSGLNDQVRKELFDATKSAATAALSERIGGFADSLHDRTLQLDAGDDDSGQARDADEKDADGASIDEDDRDLRDDGADQRGDDERGSRTDDEAEPQAKPRTTRSAGSAAKKAKDQAPKPRKTASTGGNRASGTARKTASPARRTTSGARKSASSTHRTASGTARKAGNRGGGNA